MITNIIGRESEIALLDTIWHSKDAEFVAIYGRRRVGKTHLIREYFSSKGTYFELTGLKDGSMHDQLVNFSQNFAKLFYPGINIQKPSSWKDAFIQLTQTLEDQPKQKKITLFLDELPWLATKRSQFIQNLDYYWNTSWSKMRNLKLIVCGSAASWMLDNLINAKGGLYNRLTNTLLLKPFDLKQTKAFLASKDIKLNNKQVLDIYAVVGGIPHYLKHIKKSKSATQNINDICFKQDGLLYNEFSRLFASLFDDAEISLKIIREIAKARHGIPKQQLVNALEKKSGGTFTKKIQELEAAGFIQTYIPYGKKNRDQYCKIIDEYSYFYLTWIEEYHRNDVMNQHKNYWMLASQTQAWKTWMGYAFESICYKHINDIRHALEVDNIHCRVGNWQYTPKKTSTQSGAQIDLIIERSDGITNLCEIKYSHKKLLIDRALAKNLLNKIDSYESQFNRTQHISLAIITTEGLKANSWSQELVDNVVVLDDLF